MSDLDQKFQAAAEEVKKFTKRPTDQELLDLYGLYKQATVGDNTTAQPWAVQIEARAKWEAWTKNKGTSQDDAKNKYISLVNEFKGKYA
eukprot:TRINITY_DN41493_c0_g1_i1.p1 TRINITY_DN41493_c0_g1~~TRINITY_DN41493_c0_g1_i1.p1  ORF type:complete len:89 (-),score=55.72 TRINITY_DN41493_c0_g1_i1:56-322(-)